MTTQTIPKGWTVTTLGDEIANVVDNRGKTPSVTTSGFELLEVNAISESSREPDYSKVTKYIDKDTYLNWFRTGHIQKKDILVPTVGTIGNVAFSKLARGSIAQNLIALRSKETTEALFVFYFLKTPECKKSRQKRRLRTPLGACY